MSEPLPTRANLEYLKKACKQRVKALRAAGKSTSLAAVQRDIARHHGFKSWAALAAHLKNAPAKSTPVDDAQLLDLLVWPAHLGTRSTSEASRIAREHPQFAAHSIYAAAALGSPTHLRKHLQMEPALATQPGGIRNWPPLLYLCFSRLLAAEKSPARRREFTACARLLLDAGADANSTFINPGDQMAESALYGASGIANNPALTKLLLDRGANVNDNETLYHTAEHSTHACLKLILAKKPDLLSYCMCHKMDFEDPKGVQVFLDFGADPNYLIDRGANNIQGLRPLHFAILRGRSPAVIRVLLKNGADPSLTTVSGHTPWALATRLGRSKLAALLRTGTEPELAPREQFIAACTAGNGKAARKLLAATPELLQNLDPHDAALLPTAADEGRYAAVKLMLDLGFPIDAPGSWGGTALHHAAWCGHPKIVKLLLDRGARTDTRQHFGGDALNTAIHGTMHGRHNHGPEIVRLIAARMIAPDWQKYLQHAKAEGATALIPILESFAGRSPK